MQLWETGLISHWVSKPPEQGSGKEVKCFAKNVEAKASARQVPIKKEDLMGAFLILGIGNGLAFLIPESKL